MYNLIKIDNNNIIRSYIMKLNLDKEDADWIQLDKPPEKPLFNINFQKYINGKIVDSGIPVIPPSEWHRWDNSTGNWVDNRTSTEKTAQQWQEVKAKRNQLLQESDWTDTYSASTRLSNYNAWQDYRQALRDVTNQTDPFNILWPVTPK